ncbi:MAG: RluA family pseudouridine synthase [Candidatus Krumholzibacteriia bacterium]
MTAEKNNEEVLPVGPDAAGRRLDVFCAANIPLLSRSQVQRINREGAIEVDGVRRPGHYLLKTGETVRVTVAVRPQADPPKPQDIPLRVVWEDDDILVVNKDAGLVVHPAYGNEDGTMVNAILGRGSRLSALGGEDRPGIVHRLDKDTSGLIVAAKSDRAYRGLSEQVRTGGFHKTYHAIVWGNLTPRRQTIDAPISRHPVHRKKMAVARRGGKAAITEVFVVDSFEYFDYIRVVTLTGRTHQIRVHLTHASHPILGDDVYGGRRRKGLPSNARTRAHIRSVQQVMPRQALHASNLAFVHPASGERLDFRTALPGDMRCTLEVLYGGTPVQGG